MSMNIKNAETERLARRLATATGESLTTAITVALKERLERVEHHDSAELTRQRAERILALGRDIAPRLKEPWASQDHGDLLYDDAGLPR